MAKRRTGGNRRLYENGAEVFASRTYRSWVSMRQRCTDQNSPDYGSYGGRGITFCAAWNTYTNFLADMGERPAGTTLDRIDVNGNYEPGNCRWADTKTQQRNRRTARFETAYGETKTVADWADDSRCVVSVSTVHARLARGWTIERAICTPRVKTKPSGSGRAAVACAQ